MTKKKHAGGRPKIIIDFTLLDKLCGLHCTQEEIASILNISVDTLNNKCKSIFKMSFSDYISQKKRSGNISLRRKQMEVALSGDKTMLIWLGKQYLGQVDKQETEITGDIKIKVNFKDD